MATAIQALSVAGVAARLPGLATSGGTITNGNRAAGCMSKAALAAALAPAFTAGAGAITGGNRAGAALSVETLEAELLADGVFTAAAGGGDTTAPTVSLTAPAAGTVSGTVTVSATANDNVAVVGVQFLLDGAALGAEDTTAPYSVSWDTTTATDGAHTLTARARDAAGNQTTSAPVAVTVNNSGVAAPAFSGEIPEINTTIAAAPATYDAAQHFTGSGLTYALQTAAGVGMIPGITINSTTGLITIDPTVEGLTWAWVRATNAGGFDDSNTFPVVVAQ